MTTRLGVISVQILACLGYLAYFAISDAPPAFSTNDWLFLLVPPVLLGGLLELGRRLPPARPDWLRQAARFSNIAVAIGFAGALLLIPLSVFGNLTEI